MKKLFLDNTTLSSVAGCSLEAVLAYIKGYVPADSIKQAPRRAGIGIHESFDTWFKLPEEEARSLEGIAKALAALDASHKEWSLKHVPTDNARSWQTVRAILEQWLLHPPKLPFRWPQPEHVERAFAWPLCQYGGFDIWFAGKLDMLTSSIEVPHHWHVVEHKSGGSLTSVWHDRWRTSSQISGYAYSSQKLLSALVPEPDAKLVSTYINGIELKAPKLGRSEKSKCKMHGVHPRECSASRDHLNHSLTSKLRNKQQLDEWYRTTVRLAKRFVNLLLQFGGAPDEALTACPTEGTFTGECRFCDFNEFCSDGRPYRSRDFYMVPKTPWAPFTAEQWERGEVLVPKGALAVAGTGKEA